MVGIYVYNKKEMTFLEYESRLEYIKDLSSNIVKYVIVPNGYIMLAQMKNRIQERGQNSNEGQLGKYSTKPLYATRNQFFNAGAFRATGKPSTLRSKPQKIFTKDIPKGANVLGGSVRKSDNSKKTMYLPFGYKQLRDIQGLQTSYIDLTYSGKTMQDFQAAEIPEGMDIGFTSVRSAVVMDKIEHHFGRVSTPSANEMQAYENRVIEGVAVYLSNAINSADITSAQSVIL